MTKALFCLCVTNLRDSLPFPSPPEKELDQHLSSHAQTSLWPVCLKIKELH